MSHPALGLPPAQPTPLAAAADRLLSRRDAIAARAIEIVIEIDPAFRERYDDLALRGILADCAVHLEKLAASLATADPGITARWAETVVPIYRSRRISADDFGTILEAVRTAALEELGDEMDAAQPILDAAVDAAALRLDHFRRIAGDAHKRDPLVSFLYKGA